MRTKLFLLLLLAICIFPNLLFSQFTQQGLKLVGTGGVGGSNQGSSVAISSDGNTAIWGGVYDSSGTGAAWVFTRSGGVWTQQGPKLVGSGSVGSPVYQGKSVAISSDGNTAVVGGYGDNGYTGAVWVFIRSGGVWAQQGTKLVGTDAVGNSRLGFSVALSSDGNTIIVGGDGDNGFVGAIWIFTRSGGVWTQQGTKHVGTGASGASHQGWSVAVSPDGNTALTGGPFDNSSAGAIWIFTRSGGVWTQQGAKLIGTGAAGDAGQGSSVAISSEGTCIEGGIYDNLYAGAIWVFTRSGSVWTQQGTKLVGTGASGNAEQGGSVAISSNGNTAIEGGITDLNTIGAVWAFTRSSGVWTQVGSKLVGTGAIGTAEQGNSVAISLNGGTFIEGGVSDHNNTGAVWIFVNQSIIITTISTEIPKDYSLSQNYPNPFNPSTNIRYDLPKNGFVKLVVFDELGREIETLVNEKQTAGTYEATMNASQYPSGVYFYKLTTDNFTETKKMLMIK